MPTTGLRCRRPSRSAGLVAHAAAFQVPSWTLSCCARIESQPATWQRYGLATKGFNGCWALEYREDSGLYYVRASFKATTGTNYSLEAAYTMAVGQWYGLAAGYDQATGALEIWAARMASPLVASAGSYTSIGSSTLSGTPTPRAGTQSVGLGCVADALGEGPEHVANVTLAEVAVYSAKLSKATLDGRLGTRLTGNETSLVAYWPLEDGEGEAAVGIKGYNAALVNRPEWADGPLDLYYAKGRAQTGWLGYASATQRPLTTIAASTAAAGYAAANLKNPRASVTTRTTTVAGTSTWVIALDQRVPVFGVVVRGHNLTSAAVVTIEGHTADSWGSPTVTERVRYRSGPMPHVFGQPWSLPYWRLTVADSTNGAGYLELGAVDLWQVHVPMDPPAFGGDSMGLLDASTSTTTAHSVDAARSLVRHRTRSISWPILRRADAARLWERLRELEVGAPVWAVRDGGRDLGRPGFLLSQGSYAPAEPSGEHWSVGPVAWREDIPTAPTVAVPADTDAVGGEFSETEFDEGFDGGM